VADEPTGDLDQSAEAAVLDLRADRADRGVAVLVASHSPAVAAAADRVLVMVDGQLTPRGRRLPRRAMEHRDLWCPAV